MIDDGEVLSLVREAMSGDLSHIGPIRLEATRQFSYSRPLGRACPTQYTPKKGKNLDIETLEPVANAKSLVTRSKAEAQFMASMDRSSEILWWAYEPVKLTTTDGGSVPDFICRMNDGTTRLVEVKGAVSDFIHPQSMKIARLWSIEAEMTYHVYLVGAVADFFTRLAKDQGTRGEYYLHAILGGSIRSFGSPYVHICETPSEYQVRLYTDRAQASKAYNLETAQQLFGRDQYSPQWQPLPANASFAGTNILDWVPIRWVAYAHSSLKQSKPSDSVLSGGWNSRNLLDHKSAANVPHWLLDPINAYVFTKQLARGHTVVYIDDYANIQVPTPTKIGRISRCLQCIGSDAFCLILNQAGRKTCTFIAFGSLKQNEPASEAVYMVSIEDDMPKSNSYLEIVNDHVLDESYIQDCPTEFRSTLRFLNLVATDELRLEELGSDSEIGWEIIRYPAREMRSCLVVAR